MAQKRQFATIAAIIALIAVGCGSQSQQPEHLALVAVADPICQKVAIQSARANAALQHASKSKAKTLHVLAQVAPGIALSEHDAVEALAALKESGSQTKDWQTLLVGMRQLASDSKRLADAARAKNLHAIHKINIDGLKIQQRLAVIAQRDGFSYCGRPG